MLFTLNMEMNLMFENMKEDMIYKNLFNGEWVKSKKDKTI